MFQLSCATKMNSEIVSLFEQRPPMTVDPKAEYDISAHVTSNDKSSNLLLKSLSDQRLKDLSENGGLQLLGLLHREIVNRASKRQLWLAKYDLLIEEQEKEIFVLLSELKVLTLELEHRSATNNYDSMELFYAYCQPVVFHLFQRIVLHTFPEHQSYENSFVALDGSFVIRDLLLAEDRLYQQNPSIESENQYNIRIQGTALLFKHCIVPIPLKPRPDPSYCFSSNVSLMSMFSRHFELYHNKVRYVEVLGMFFTILFINGCLPKLRQSGILQCFMTIAMVSQMSGAINTLLHALMHVTLNDPESCSLILQVNGSVDFLLAAIMLNEYLNDDNEMLRSDEYKDMEFIAGRASRILWNILRSLDRNTLETYFDRNSLYPILATLIFPKQYTVSSCCFLYYFAEHFPEDRQLMRQLGIPDQLAMLNASLGNSFEISLKQHLEMLMKLLEDGNE